ncbi:GIY-YIG nuclease family protein [Streptomyces kaniharaensis]|uniref:GIY-YIG nuclease family protein n=1 Tax=Streptomyces kaniharaensis TaxID=212423 RepID=A0A6N7KV88_9ACTN|nr:GIY-YIG nuclease family protein [Streptomyces kaniharaensis]MQS14745.1 GIY-YIG nuclease family protein [Streptomyces kaniharaensis]
MTDALSLINFSMRDVDQAPESPGLYAWYVSFRAGPHDWKIKPGPNGDQAIEGFLNLLRKYAGYYEPLPIGLAGRGAYGAKWQGSLELDYPLREPQDETRVNEDDAAKRLDILMDSLDTEDRRRIMATILQRSAPVFSAPLYIGVAENLRQRLSQHRRDYTKSYDWLRDHPEDAEEVKARGKSFGARAAARNIAMEHLEAWVIDLADEENDEVTKKHLRNTAESAEWLLHRLYSPILGRQ